MPGGHRVSPVRASDQWGRPAPEPISVDSGAESLGAKALRSVIRGTTYILGALLVFTIVWGLGWTGSFGNWFLLAHLSLVPAAGICWVLAAVTPAGDRWTVGYVMVVALDFGYYLIALG